MLTIYIGIVVLILLDQLSKWWIVNHFALHTGQSLIDGILSLFYIQNDGAAWGILSGNMVFFFIVTVIVLGGLMYWIHKQTRHAAEKMAYMFIVAGAVGNFIDRLRLGYVIDMIRIDFFDFPIFNIADMQLTVGVMILLIYSFVSEMKGREHG